jgi:ribosomal protein S18 acetylase RimI-like enzyme
MVFTVPGNKSSAKKTIDTMFQIRTFRYPQDYAEVYRLWEQSGPGVHLSPSDEPGEIENKLQRDPDLFLVAVSDDKIIGTVLGGFDGRRGMMYHLAVLKDYRHAGAGSALMLELEKRLVARGCIRYYLMVTEDNPDAIPFYEKRGCERMNITILGKNLA